MERALLFLSFLFFLWQTWSHNYINFRLVVLKIRKLSAPANRTDI